MLKDELKSKIDVCFNQVTANLFLRQYGADWYTKELLPYMRNIRSYSDDGKLIGDYERFIYHNKNFSNADTTICAKLLLFDERYSHLVGRADGWQLLKHLLYYRNECSHSVQDISMEMYRDGLNSIEKANRFLENNVTENTMQSDYRRTENSERNEIKRYYDGVREKVGNVMSWLIRILLLISLVGAVLGCMFIFRHRENNLRWWMSDGLRLIPYIYIAYIAGSVASGVGKLDEDWKYTGSTSRIQIVFKNIISVAWAFIVNAGCAIALFLSMGISVFVVNALESLLGLVIDGISFPSVVKAGFVCAVLFWPYIWLWVKFLKSIYMKFVNKKIEKNPALIFRCPKCKTKVRVANGVKKVLITCPNCKKQFIRRRVWKSIFSSKK